MILLMTIVLIHHPSQLTAHIIGLSILEAFRENRGVHIVIVLSNHSTTDDRLLNVQPWCISPLGQMGKEDSALNFRSILIKLLSLKDSGMFLVSSIQIFKRENGYISWDLPRKASEISIKLSLTHDASHAEAFLYQPYLLSMKIRDFLLRTDRASFISLGKFNIDRVVLAILIDRPLEDIILLDFEQIYRLKYGVSDMIVNLNLMRAVYTNVRPQSSYDLPIFVRWLPILRAQLGTPDHRLVKPHISRYGKSYKFSYHFGDGILREYVLSRLDVLYASAVAYACTNEMKNLASSSRLSLNFTKL